MIQLLAVMMAHVSMTSSRRRRKDFWLIVSISARRAKSIMHNGTDIHHCFCTGSFNKHTEGFWMSASL
jgi:hypothetical protein